MSDFDDFSELDDLDAEILARVRSVHDELDPPPPMLDDLVLFALGPARLDHELARLVEEDRTVSAVRGSARTRTLTFEAAELTLLLTVVDLPGDQVRVDGWLAPAAEVEIELRLLADEVRTERTQTEPTGRFVFPSVPRGSVQLVVLREPRVVITPATPL